jgi:hypothetical protein
MSDTLAPAVPIRPGLVARYGDTQAINDIHALLTGAVRLTGDEAAACVAEIVARTGRRLDPARAVTAEVTSDKHGTPVARAGADGTIVPAGQDPDGPGTLVRVTTRDQAEAAGLVITVDGRPAGRSPVGPAGPGRAGRIPRRTMADPGGQLPGAPDGEGKSS